MMSKMSNVFGVVVALFSLVLWIAVVELFVTASVVASENSSTAQRKERDALQKVLRRARK